MSVNDALPILRSQMSRLRIPSQQDKIYKDECVYSFDSPYSDTGLYVNLVTFFGCSQRYLFVDAQKSNNRIYLFEKWQQVPKEVEETETEQISKLAIGVEGGFNSNSKFDVIKEHSLVILNESKTEVFTTIPLPNAQIPEFISNICNEIIKHSGMRVNLEVSTWEADNEKVVSKYAATLEQINPSNKRISQDPKQWKDEASDATDNLWLNLSTGYIGGGRKLWDGTGGSGSALQHYIDTGRKYPLVVKLGTITPHGADVWSYAADEDRLVIDPNLAEHLSFWGIDAMKLEKTDKTMSELEVNLNRTYDWSKIVDSNEKLEPITGPGYIGLRNIGSTCYMNSLLQVILSIPEFRERYFLPHEQIIQTYNSNDPAKDFSIQLSKLSHALFSETYVPPLPAQGNGNDSTYEENAKDESLLEKYVIAPRMLKHCVAGTHPEFSSGRQQDVTEYFTYFLDQLNRSERVNLHRLIPGGILDAPSTDSIFNFGLEIKFKDLNSSDVKLINKGPQTLNNLLELPIPLDKAVPKPTANINENSKEDGNEAKRQKIEDPNNDDRMVRLDDCLAKFFEPEVLLMKHPATQEKLPFQRTLKFHTFPRYLVIKLSRYYVTENWTQKKILLEVPMPETLDLNQYRGHGLSPGEKEIIENNNSGSVGSAQAAPVFTIDEELVMNLVSMGFSENGCRRAAIATNNADMETAMNWILEHMEDPDFNSPPVLPSTTGGAADNNGLPEVSEESIQMLTVMGYTEEQCRAALIATNQNIERAADWLFSHVEDLDQAVAEALGRSAPAAGGNTNQGDSRSNNGLDSGEGKYTLFAIISHIGRNTEHGHYVCHIKKNGQWTFFNDEKVAKCEKPPLGHGFVYVYRRDDGPQTFFA